MARRVGKERCSPAAVSTRRLAEREQSARWTYFEWAKSFAWDLECGELGASTSSCRRAAGAKNEYADGPPTKGAADSRLVRVGRLLLDVALQHEDQTVVQRDQPAHQVQ